MGARTDLVKALKKQKKKWHGFGHYNFLATYLLCIHAQKPINCVTMYVGCFLHLAKLLSRQLWLTFFCSLCLIKYIARIISL